VNINTEPDLLFLTTPLSIDRRTVVTVAADSEDDATDYGIYYAND